MAKIPGQKATHNDISKATRNEIMNDIKRAHATDKCTADEIARKKK